MADQNSPFSGLDKALLRSTKPKPAAPEPSATSQEQAVVELPRTASPSQPQPLSPLRERPNAPTTERPNGRRIITRNSFEIYEDQMDALRELAYREKREGKPGSMSAMVRAAIDRFIEKANNPASEK
jgi:hypothetical protein